ncbi:mediator of RNA polymerase II transcription subunit 27-like [Neodiprion fabricii]|uniref:mediator of RNA polymerase II transcription subunit 27-like n=1 Tax=Neodiprion fabricii TaxID=2872261 RepID=UPI001ED8C7FA|nr:mediator of RNA polymerase II transcription subunit 27-like [Neodiprion fabricii]
MAELQTALTAIRLLRISVRQLFNPVGSGQGVDGGEDNSMTNFPRDLQEFLSTIASRVRDVEQAVNTLEPTPEPFDLPSMMYLGQHTTQEGQAFHDTLVNTYRWIKDVEEKSGVAQTLLSQNSMTRSYLTAGRPVKKRLRTASHNVPPEQVDSVIMTIDRLYDDMTITISRQLSSNAVLHVTLGHILKAVIACKGLLIESVVIKGYGESTDLWTESRHEVFKKLTENAYAAMLHFDSPTSPECSVISFMDWFHSFTNLFSVPCKRCGLYLHNFLPPTWRDFDTLEPYHQECRAS